jgi:bifunctional UDP-N-acetylglucosamine pyrophosphorylase/glucosamine-1-phosphate N-acetyltransferase
LCKVASVLVAAAGRGARAGLPYPKTLYPVRGRPTLVRILETLSNLDQRPTVVISPSGRIPISKCLSRFNISAHMVEQSEPKGMGDAVLCFRKSGAYGSSNNVLLIWGDIPLIEKATVDAMVTAHVENDNDFTFVTGWVSNAYTLVERCARGQVVGVLESRELGPWETIVGERDIGLFIFRRDLVLDLLEQDLPGKLGKISGEHGFLYVIRLLTSRGHRVVGLPIATELDLVSLNSVSDLGEYA